MQIPVERLHEEAHTLKDDGTDDFGDALMKALLAWYKKEYMTWVNSPKCDYCGSETSGIGGAGPTAEELRCGANRVEVYKCSSMTCNGITRFPRYKYAF
jgi:peptide-N4-(N-acetyl-beta-glucosaminyl)asparagine amidase